MISWSQLTNQLIIATCSWVTLYKNICPGRISMPLAMGCNEPCGCSSILANLVAVYLRRLHGRHRWIETNNNLYENQAISQVKPAPNQVSENPCKDWRNSKMEKHSCTHSHIHAHRHCTGSRVLLPSGSIDAADIECHNEDRPHNLSIKIGDFCGT